MLDVRQRQRITEELLRDRVRLQMRALRVPPITTAEEWRHVRERRRITIIMARVRVQRECRGQELLKIIPELRRDR